MNLNWMRKTAKKFANLMVEGLTKGEPARAVTFSNEENGLTVLGGKIIMTKSYTRSLIIASFEKGVNWCRERTKDSIGLDKGNAEVKPYPSGVNIIREDGVTIHIDIQFLGKLVSEWRKSNPDIDFEGYSEK